MNPIGVCTWIWVSPFTDESVSLVAHAKEVGADVLELCIEDTSVVTGEAVRAAADGIDIAFSVCGAFGEDRDLSHEDPRSGGRGWTTCEFLIDLAAAIGAPNVVGPMYSAVGKARMLSADEREQQRRLGGREHRRGRRLRRRARRASRSRAAEPLRDRSREHRRAGARAVRPGRPRQRRRPARHLPHEHRGEVHPATRSGWPATGCSTSTPARTTAARPGTGHVPWPEVFGALHDIGYGGQLVTESFTPDVQEIAKAVSMWRPLDATGDDMARKSLEFVRAGVRAAVPAAAV